MTRSRQPADPALSAAEIDALYGLDPVLEPEAAAIHPTEFVTVSCPYCGEPFDTAVDLSAGAFSYVEDCQVCCQPIELASESDADGAFTGVRASRAG